MLTITRSTPPARVHFLHRTVAVVHCGSFGAVVTDDGPTQRLMLWVRNTDLLRDLTLPTRHAVAVRFARLLVHRAHRIACELAEHMRWAA